MGPVISTGNKNFTYYACVAEPSSGRLLPSVIADTDTMSIETCLAQCYAYRFAGVEYGSECWCGDTLNLAGDGVATTTPGQNVTSSECEFTCPGNATEFCGAGLRMSLYSRVF